MIPLRPDYPDRMDSFLTTEHFTLQSARGITNGEIVSRVTIYFTTLSSVLIAAAFLAQLSRLDNLFSLFTWIAFPLLVLLGFFTMTRLMILGRRDVEYIRAINRIRHFYIRAAPEVERFLYFPPYDDHRSASLYGGYSMDFRGNLLSAANAVNVTNSVLATVLLSMLIGPALGLPALGFLPYSVGIFALVYFVHGLLGSMFGRTYFGSESGETRFPAPGSGPPADEPGGGRQGPGLETGPADHTL